MSATWNSLSGDDADHRRIWLCFRGIHGASNNVPPGTLIRINPMYFERTDPHINW